MPYTYGSVNYVTKRTPILAEQSKKCHKRTNGHRACFNNGDIQKSALSMHAMDKHPGDITLENFEIAIVKQTSPRNLKREEFRMIDKCRTKYLGLNRYKTFI